MAYTTVMSVATPRSTRQRAKITASPAVGEVALQVGLEHRDVEGGVAVALHHRAKHAPYPRART